MTRKSCQLLRTEGYALEATIEVDGAVLIAMDGVSDEDEPASPGMLVEPSFGALLEDQSWESLFQGNPDEQKRVIRRSGWSYVALGQIVAVAPVLVDVGPFTIDVGEWTHDARCIGEYVAVHVARLDVSAKAVV